MLNIISGVEQFLNELSRCSTFDEAFKVISSVKGDMTSDLREVVDYVFKMHEIEEDLDGMPLEYIADTITQLRVDGQKGKKMEAFTDKAYKTYYSKLRAEEEFLKKIVSRFKEFKQMDFDELSPSIRALKSQLRRVFIDSTVLLHKYYTKDSKYVSYFIWCIDALLKLNEFFNCFDKSEITDLIQLIDYNKLDETAKTLYDKYVCVIDRDVVVKMANGYEAVVSFDSNGDWVSVSVNKKE